MILLYSIDNIKIFDAADLPGHLANTNPLCTVPPIIPSKSSIPDMDLVSDGHAIIVLKKTFQGCYS